MNLRKIKTLWLVLILMFTVNMSASDKPCEQNGFKLYGKVQFVDAFPDLKIEYVNAFSDIDVEFVTAFADSCGEWQIVDAFPDIKVQVVTAFADLKVRKVTAFPGMR
jgi:hypothetical protein